MALLLPRQSEVSGPSVLGGEGAKAMLAYCFKRRESERRWPGGGGQEEEEEEEEEEEKDEEEEEEKDEDEDGEVEVE